MPKGLDTRSKTFRYSSLSYMQTDALIVLTDNLYGLGNCII